MAPHTDFLEKPRALAAEPVFFFDIDNCLYPPSTGIAQIMKERIHAYGIKIGIPQEQVETLCETYYRDYGLAIRGLLEHHVIDPVDYDREVDGSLPLEALLRPNPDLRAMLSRLTVRRVAFTNAGKQHATRVLKCLGIDDLFELVIYCDYGLPDFTCKPEEQSFDRAMRLAQVTDPDQCYFVDDSADNVHMAKSLGWHTVHLCPSGASDAGDHQIQDILTLPRIYPDLWAPSSSPSP